MAIGLAVQQIDRAIVREMSDRIIAATALHLSCPLVMRDRLRVLLDRSKSGSLTPGERQELDDYEQIEHWVMMLKPSAWPETINL
ncbi:MAG: hypothetical protein RLZZ511_3571 [Cyanobacteriota bacterium]